MTSLIDVIFLLLLFFMLTSTFSKFAEVELTAAGQSATVSSDQPPLFLRLQADDLSLNGQSLPLETLAGALASEADSETTRNLILALAADVSSQRLTDLLVILRGVSGIVPSVLGGPT